MRIKYLLVLTGLLAFLSPAHAQNAYHFQYRQYNPADTTRYDAFFVQQSGGTGFMRVRYTDRGSGDLVLAEIKLHIHEPDIGSGMQDANHVYYDTVGTPDFKFGSSNTALPIPLFGFSLDSLSGHFEPGGVSFADSLGLLHTGQLITTTFLSPGDLGRDFLAQFFSPGEDYYDGSTQPSSRGLTDLEKQTKLFLVIIANTNDPTVGKSAWLDMGHIIKTFDSLTRFMGIIMPEPVTIYGSNYNKATVQKAVNDIHPGKNDIVVFYYTGHGFRKAADPRPFPFIDLRPKDDNTYMVNSLNIKDIYDQLKTKPARFNLVISDCCNNDPNEEKSTGSSVVAERGITEWSLDNCAALFLHSTGSILYTAAGVGEKATCDTTSGSYCSLFFISALQNNLAKTNKHPDWTTLLNEAISQTTYRARHVCCDPALPCTWSNGCIQHPVSHIEAGKNQLLERFF